MPRIQKIPEEEIKLYHIFADETCHEEAGKEKHEWMALGATSVSDEHLAHVRAMFKAWKKRRGLKGEIKWTRTDDSNVERYMLLTTAYINLLNLGILQFNSMVIPKVAFEDPYWDEEVPEIAYNRCFHHLLLHKYCERPIAARKYFVLFDERTSKVPWEPFRLSICRAAHRRAGMDHWPFRRMGYEKSKLEIMLQMNDLILGALGFCQNKKHTRAPTATSPKADLARHIRKTLDFSLTKPPFHSKKYTVWPLTPKVRTRAP